MKRDVEPRGGGASADLRARLDAAYAGDPFSRSLEFRVLDLRPGEALLAAEIEGVKLNAHGTGHGGALWTLADMAFGAATFHRGHLMTVGSDLTFLRPAPAGATVHAHAREVGATASSATYHVVLALDPHDPATVVASGSFSGRRPPRG